MRIVFILLLITLVGRALAQTSGQLRLVRNGNSYITYTSGRLEVYYSGQWGTVCNDLWDSTNTRVACRQLGFLGSSTSWTTSSAGGFGSTTRRIWLDNVRCSGTESRLTSCSRNSYGSHNCVHSEDVAIYCSCSSTQFRCASGECIPTFARCGGIRTCSDGSDERNCTSCGTGAFRCTNNQCIRSSDRCDGTRECTDGSDETGCPSSGDLRLVRNGFTSTSYTRGRLEVYYSGQWGTVCDDFWSSTNTRVACRQLGFSSSSTSWTTSSAGGFGSTTRRIWLDNVRCSGTESRLTSCSRNFYGSHDCVHSEDVAIDCTTGCRSTQFRCTNGQCISSSSRCGGVRTCSDGSDERNCVFCSIGAFRCTNGQCIRSSDRCDGTRDCTDGSDETGCCRSTQFRCTNGQCISSSSRCGGVRTCSDGSDERNCLFCSSGAFRCTNGQCIRSSDRCDGTRHCTDGSDETGCSTPSSGDLRLVRNGVTSSSYTSGRLEVYYSGRWGTVCDDYWSSTNTRVACRQLGFAGAASPTSYRTSSAAGFGTGSGRIWLDNVRCRGTESRLTSCRRNSYGAHNCGHSEDVAIYCSTTSSSSGTSIPPASGSAVGTAVGASLASLVLFVIIPVVTCVVVGCCVASRRRQTTVTTATQPVAPTTTVVTSSQQQSAQQDAYPAAGTDIKKAPPPSYEMSTYPHQAAYPYPPQEVYPPPPQAAYPYPPQDVYPPPPQAAYPYPPQDVYPPPPEATYPQQY